MQPAKITIKNWQEVSYFQILDMMVVIDFAATNFVTLLHASTVPTVHSFLFLGHIVLGRNQRFLKFMKKNSLIKS